MIQAAVHRSFFESARKLSTANRAKIIDFVDKFLEDPTRKGFNLERIQSAKDPGMRSARVNDQVRVAIHHKDGRYLLLHVHGEHDNPYEWAAKRIVGEHEATGELQIYVAPETELEAPPTKPGEKPAGTTPPLFPASEYADDYLLSLGVPKDWLPSIRHFKTKEQLEEAVPKLPEEVGLRLLYLADGEVVTPPAPTPAEAPLDANPSNLRRFWVIDENTDIKAELEKPMTAWLRYLHPTQRELVDKAWNGPVKVTGAAGTGKTVVAMHRARALARQGKRVLVTSFVGTLCDNIRQNLEILCSAEEREHITVGTVHARALATVRRKQPRTEAIENDRLQSLLEKAGKTAAPEFAPEFLFAEWENVLEREAAQDWPAYRDAQRVGRGKPLQIRDRKRIWGVFERVLEELDDRSLSTFGNLCRRAEELIRGGEVESPFDAVIVDEVQDLKPAELKFLASLAGTQETPSLMLCGDAGQRIYPGGFSLRALGIETRGRSRILRINYRTTEQIRRAADLLRGDDVEDLDGASEGKLASRSLLRGPAPQLEYFGSPSAEAAYICEQIERVRKEGVPLEEMAIFARTARVLEPVKKKLEDAGIPAHSLATKEPPPSGAIRFGSMHRAKGLEFRVVFVCACRDGVVPSKFVLAKISDPVDRNAALRIEKNLVYVSLTRARDEAFVSWHGDPSPFLEPLIK